MARSKSRTRTAASKSPSRRVKTPKSTKNSKNASKKTFSPETSPSRSTSPVKEVKTPRGRSRGRPRKTESAKVVPAAATKRSTSRGRTITTPVKMLSSPIVALKTTPLSSKPENELKQRSIRSLTQERPPSRVASPVKKPESNTASMCSCLQNLKAKYRRAMQTPTADMIIKQSVNVVGFVVIFLIFYTLFDVIGFKQIKDHIVAMAIAVKAKASAVAQTVSQTVVQTFNKIKPQ